ncbi:MAG: DNA replication and repair protein RecF [Candidatus Peribacteraceae bacterium]
MRLRKLRLQGFRSYATLDLDIDPERRTLFFGSNGSGKTNLIEALSYLSAGRSCLRLAPDTAVRWGDMFFRLEADATSDSGEDLTLEYVFQTTPKRQNACFIRGQRSPLTSFIGALPTIIFLPEHLDLFSGAPQGRRQFIDALLAQLIPGFPAARLEYDRILKQRNAALKMIALGSLPQAELMIWNRQLAASAIPIVQHRRTVLSALSSALPDAAEHFGESWQDVRIDVQSRGGDSEASFLAALEEQVTRDLVTQTTSVGPHRDDWQIVVDTRALPTFASRGQQRAALLSLLVASASLFTEYRKERPIILLDDVYSELDAAHQEALTATLSDAQILMTSTHSAPGHPELLQRLVSDGSVRDADV